MPASEAVGGVAGGQVTVGAGGQVAVDGAGDWVFSTPGPADEAPPPPVLTIRTARRARMTRTRTTRPTKANIAILETLFNIILRLNTSFWISSVFCPWIPTSFS